MKKVLLAFLVISLVITSCKNTKKATSTMPNISSLNGTWELNYISGPRIAFDGLFPKKKPTITFDATTKKVNGNSSCNNFNGALNADGNKIDFTQPMAMTRMACMDGNGEQVFMDVLKKVNGWSVTDGNTLNLLTGDVPMMRFTKK